MTEQSAQQTIPTETHEPSLPLLAAQRADAIHDENWRRAGGPAYVAAIGPDVAVAERKIADRRRLADDGTTLKALREKHAEIRATREELAEESRRDAKLDTLLRDTEAALARQIELLTHDLGRHEALVRAVATPTVSALRTWSFQAFLWNERERLKAIQGAEGLQELLSDWWPTQRAAIAERLSRTASVPPLSVVAPEPPAPRVTKAKVAGDAA